MESHIFGRPGTTVLGGVATSETCWNAMDTAESPVKGGFPVSISYSTQPAEYRSERISTLSPRACSGDRYCAVPTTPWDCVIVAAESSSARAMPKSMTLTMPCTEIMMLPGLISRWITPIRCEYSSAFNTPTITCSASRWLKAPFTLRMSRRVCPLTYSMTRYGRCSIWPLSPDTTSSPES